jgi:hypothetical protein
MIIFRTFETWGGMEAIFDQDDLHVILNAALVAMPSTDIIKAQWEYMYHLL